MPVPTHEVTVHRLSDAAPDLFDLTDSTVGTYLDETHANDMVLPVYEDAEAVAFHWIRDPVPAPWVKAATELIGPLPDDYQTRDCGALLHVLVDGERYAIGFGGGSRLLPPAFKDQSFGLRFVVRAVDARKVRSVARRSMTGLGRQDSTLVPSGTPIGHIGVSEYAELVRTLAGMVDPRELGLDRDKPMPVEGAAGLRLRIPLDRDRLVALLRKISEICAREPQPDFAFVEAITPVREKSRREMLDECLDHHMRPMLDEEPPEVRFASAVPVELADRMGQAQSYAIGTGPAVTPFPGWPDVDIVLSRCIQRRMPLIKALRTTDVTVCDDGDGRSGIDTSRAVQWIEAAVVLDGRQHFLLEGDWYEGGAEYFNSVRHQISGLFKEVPSVALPPWESAKRRPDTPAHKSGETVYNEWVEDEFGMERMLNLDTQGVASDFHWGKGFEPCDLLGPGNELIHVKSGSGTSPFSHLFSQALISTEALCVYPALRSKFADRVAEVSGGRRTLPTDWYPSKVILAMSIDRKNKTPLTPETLFPNAQIVLARLARTLRADFQVDVEVVAIPRTAAPAAAA